MSYILEALRRADAERERGAVPGLHTRSVSGTPMPADGRRPFATWAVGVGAGLAAALVAVLAWRLWMPSPGVVLAPVAAPVAVAPAVPPVAPPVAAAVPVPAAPPVVVVKAPIAAPVVVAPPAPSDRKVVAVVAPAAAPAPHVYTLQELPDDVRAQLPRLSVSGATYSSNPAFRMVIVNGQVLHEGEDAATGTVLEHIDPHSVVLRFRDYRYAMAY